MKTEITSLDLHYLTKELKVLVDGKIDQIYQEDKEYLFQLYHTKLGKQYLRIILPSMIYLTKHKGSYKTDKFALSLRRHLNNTFIQEISQLGFERILLLKLSSKEQIYSLYIELFKPGNIVLCDENNKILLAKEYKGFGSRMIRPGIKYEYPKSDYNFLDIDEHLFTKMLDVSDKNSIVITLAVNLGMGGLYAEELCDIAKIDKKKSSLNEKEKKRLFKAIKELRNKKIKAGVYFEEDKVDEITPFELNQLSDLKYVEKETFSLAIDSFMKKKLRREEKQEKEEKHDRAKEKILGIINNQENQIKGLKRSYEENKEKAEYIYEEYNNVEKIMEKAKKALQGKEIEDDSIVKIDKKHKTVTVDLE